MFVERQAQVREHVQRQGEQVDGATAQRVGKGAEDGGRQGLEDDVEGDGEVDGLGGGVEVGAQEGEQREVDGRC